MFVKYLTNFTTLVYIIVFDRKGRDPIGVLERATIRLNKGIDIVGPRNFTFKKRERN